MAMGIVLILLVAATVVFHFVSPWWFTPIASNWGMMDRTVDITFWVTGIVFIAVNLFMAYAVIRYRHRKGRRALYEPENKRLEWWLTIITSLGIAAMLAPGLIVWSKFVTPPRDASEVEVLGQQWNWAYRFPGKDGIFGTTDIRLTTPDNSFGINPSDPIGRDDILVMAPELHLPVNKPVKFILRAKDVLHQFAVPQFRVKMDMVPGMITYFWLTPTRTGAFDALCEQLCGVAHFTMRGRVIVDEQHTFEDWLARQPTFAQTLAMVPGNIAAGRAVFTVCSACHGPGAQGNRDLNAPKLTGQASWYLVRQLQNFGQGLRGRDDSDVYGKQMAPFAAMLADDAAIKNVVAYIASLPDTRPEPTVEGNPSRGKMLYSTCAQCHGAAGQGIWSTNAPRLANMSDWYLKRQLQNFQHGLRGTHPQDFSGAQMAALAKSMSVDEQSIDDMLDHLHSL